MVVMRNKRVPLILVFERWVGRSFMLFYLVFSLVHWYTQIRLACVFLALSLSLSIYLSSHLSIYLPIYLSIYLLQSPFPFIRPFPFSWLHCVSHITMYHRLRDTTQPTSWIMSRGEAESGRLKLIKSHKNEKSRGRANTPLECYEVFGLVFLFCNPVVRRE